MKGKALRGLMIVLGLAAALAAFFVTLQIVSARNPALAGPAGAQRLSGPESAPAESPDPHPGQGCPPQSAGAVPKGQMADASLSSVTDSVPGVRFVHMATISNTVGNVTDIDHYLTNDNPYAILFVTQNWNPGGGGVGTYNDHSIGVYYDSGAGKWAVFNQDWADMPVGAAFNIMVKAHRVYLPLIVRGT